MDAGALGPGAGGTAMPMTWETTLAHRKSALKVQNCIVDRGRGIWAQLIAGGAQLIAGGAQLIAGGAQSIPGAGATFLYPRAQLLARLRKRNSIYAFPIIRRKCKIHSIQVHKAARFRSIMFLNGHGPSAGPVAGLP